MKRESRDYPIETPLPEQPIDGLERLLGKQGENPEKQQKLTRRKISTDFSGSEENEVTLELATGGGSDTPPPPRDTPTGNNEEPEEDPLDKLTTFVKNARRDHRFSDRSEQSDDPEKQISLTDKFTQSISPDYAEEGLTQTQEPKIQEIIDALQRHGADAEAIVEEVAARREKNGIIIEGDIWPKIEDLIEEAEAVTGESLDYTPDTFVESLESYAEQEVDRYRTASQEKRATQDESALAIDEATKATLKTKADAVFTNPNTIRGILSHLINTRNASLKEYVENKGIAGDPATALDIAETYIETQENDAAFHGMMRSLEVCVEETDAMSSPLEEAFPDLGFLSASGHMRGLDPHQVMLVFPDKSSRQRMTDLQDNAWKAVISLEGFEAPETPVIDELTIIDPTIIQIFNDSPFLKNIPFEERIPFAQRLAPGSFSDGGIFVGTTLEYIGFLGRLGISNPAFYCYGEETDQ